MPKRAARSADLDFLNDYTRTHAQFRRARWLPANSYEQAVWTCEFGKARMRIDFGIRLEDGSLLTDRRHRALLDTIKRFLILQTHPTWCEGMLATRGQTRHVQGAIHLLDYFFVRAQQFELARWGFSCVTPNQVDVLLDTLGSQRQVKSALYNTVEEFRTFLRNHPVTQADCEQARVEAPDIAEFEEVERRLPFDDEELLQARICLWTQGFYTPERPGKAWKYRVKRALLEHIYAGRILGNCHFPDIELTDLRFGSTTRQLREKSPVPVRGDDDEDDEADGPAESTVQDYVWILRSMEAADEHGFRLIPPVALAEIDDKLQRNSLPLRGAGRFATVPIDIINHAVGRAADFIIDYGEPLIDCYLSVARAAHASGEPLNRVSVEEHLLGPLRDRDITEWRSTRARTDAFFSELRKTPSLYQLLTVLWGAVVLIVNTVMARRSAELVSLDPQDCLQKASEGYHLRFTVGKANIGDRRIKVDRPIPDFAVQALGLLLRAQEGLKAITGTLPAYTVFSLPHWSRVRLTPATDQTVNVALDRFCDYFEIPLDDLGRRYYLRTHQLRRFFAMMFFWHFGFGGVDTLRYMLAHADFAHAWRYITENVPGKVLARVKTSFITTKLRAGSPDTQSLGALLQEQYGIAKFDILSEATVERYVDDLIMKGLADVKPEFLDDKHEWKILVQVQRRS
jgi:hypothetical protein